jgi:hypothetical protein
MDESSFLALMMRARRFSALGERTDYWHGYQRGLRRGFHGDLFGTEAEHKRWIGLADDGVDKASRERGRGYRDGLNTCGVDPEGGAPGSALSRRSDSKGQPTRAYSRRR